MRKFVVKARIAASAGMENPSQRGQNKDQQGEGGEVLQVEVFFGPRGQEEVADAEPAAPAQAGEEHEPHDPNQRVGGVCEHADKTTRALACRSMNGCASRL